MRKSSSRATVWTSFSARKRIVALALVLTASLPIAGGCFSFTAPPPLQIHTYLLDYSPPAMTGEALPVVLQISPFRIAAAYDRDSIIYRPTPQTSATYFYHRWAAPPGRMVSDLLTRDLAQSRLYRAVEKSPSLLANDFTIAADIDAIEELPQKDGCVARMQLRVVLASVHPRDGVLRQQSYEASEPCECSAPDSLTAAMGRVLARISATLQADIYESIVASQLRQARH